MALTTKREELAWLLGLIVGDGHVDKYFVEISDKYRVNLEVVGKVISSVGCRSVITKDRRENRYRLWINSKQFVTYLKNLGYLNNKVNPRYIVENQDEVTVCSYIKGLFDAEGYVEYWKPKRMVRINFTNTSPSIMMYVRKILIGIGIKPYLRFSWKAYRLQVYRKRDVENFVHKIGFEYPTKKQLLHYYLSCLSRS